MPAPGPGEHRAADRGAAAQRELRQAPARAEHEHHRARDAGERSAAAARPRHGSAIARVSTVVPARPMRTSVGPSIGGRSRRRDQSSGTKVHSSAPRQVAEVVRARQPARRMQVDDAVVQHHRQDRREREAADAHRDGERDQPGGGDGEGARSVGGRGRQRAQLDDLDPVRIAADGLAGDEREHAARGVDRVAAEPMRRLADGDERSAVGRDREAARLGFGRHRLDRRQHAALGIDRERGERARAALARVEEAAVGRQVQVGGPRRAAGETGAAARARPRRRSRRRWRDRARGRRSSRRAR